MFSVRIHSLEFAGENAGETDDAPSSNRNPHSRFRFCSGVLHLYRDSPSPSFSSSPSSSTQPQPPPTSRSSIPHLPAGRGTHILVLAVPSRLSLEDFERFCGKHIERAIVIQVIRNDAVEDRYSVLLEFDEQKSADQFYREVNGWRFTTEGELCHALFLSSVECTESTDTAGTAPAGSTQLPTCPVCIETLDQEMGGISATNSDNSLQGPCFSKWVNSSCLVCQFCQKHSDKPTCSICGTSQSLWICMICGFLGCGRYKEGHAESHWKDTQHSYSLDLETKQIWDYVGCSDEYGMGEALFRSKIEPTKDEYNRLLVSLLECQKQYYESLIQEEKVKVGHYISEAVKKAVNSKMRDIQQQINEVNREIKTITASNKKLESVQNVWRKEAEEAEEREEATLRKLDEKIHVLEEDVLDFNFFIVTRNALSTDDVARYMQGGTVLQKVSTPPSSGNANRSSGRSRRRRGR